MKSFLWFKYDDTRGKLMVKYKSNDAYITDEISQFPMLYFIPSVTETEYVYKNQYLKPVYENNISLYYREIYKNRKNKVLFANLHPALQYIAYNFYDKDSIMGSDIELATNFQNAFRIMVYDIEVLEHNFKPVHTNPVSPCILISFLDNVDKKVRVIGFQDIDRNKAKIREMKQKYEEAGFKNFDDTFSYYTKFNSEIEMLLYFLEILGNRDIIVGYNNKTFDTPYIIARLLHLLKGDDREIRKRLPFGHYEFITVRGKYGDVENVIIDGICELDFWQLLQSYDKKLKKMKLGYVAMKLIKQTKFEYKGKISVFLQNRFTEAVIYSGMDTILVSELNEKRKHIEKTLLFAYQTMINVVEHDKQILKWETIFFQEATWKYPNLLHKFFEPRLNEDF